MTRNERMTYSSMSEKIILPINLCSRSSISINKRSLFPEEKCIRIYQDHPKLRLPESDFEKVGISNFLNQLVIGDKR